MFLAAGSPLFDLDFGRPWLAAVAAAAAAATTRGLTARLGPWRSANAPSGVSLAPAGCPSRLEYFVPQKLS